MLYCCCTAASCDVASRWPETQMRHEDTAWERGQACERANSESSGDGRAARWALRRTTDTTALPSTASTAVASRAASTAPSSLASIPSEPRHQYYVINRDLATTSGRAHLPATQQRRRNVTQIHKNEYRSICRGSFETSEVTEIPGLWER